MTQTALITGGAQRIGAAIAHFLHDKGFNLVIHYRQSSDAAHKLIEQLNRSRSQSAIAVQADLLNTDALPELIDKAVDQWQRLDLLVNNASSFYPTPVGEINEAQWQDIMGSNIKAPVFLSQAAAPHLKITFGSIINMVDIHAERPMRKHTVYSAAKAALVSLTKSLARELAPEVRVNAVAPGAILWPERDMSEQTKQSILDRVPLQRCGDPSDIARAVYYLAVEAGYTTGHVLPVDGGRHLYI